MESVASSSSARPDHPLPRYGPTQPVADRVIRALRHRLLLLHRSDSLFFILGATGNVYTVNLSATPSCSCPDRTKPCKHILFVLIRVLGVSLDDSCIWRRALRPWQLHRLLSLPTSTEALAGATIRERFHQLYSQQTSNRSNNSSTRPSIEIKDGASCPICLEDMVMMANNNNKKKIVSCGTCRNPVHEECLMEWKRRSRKRWISCVLCRARWRDANSIQEKYINLSAFITDEHNHHHTVDGDAHCGP